MIQFLLQFDKLYVFCQIVNTKLVKAFGNLQSFQEYLLIEQGCYHVTHYGSESAVKLAAVDCELTMAEIYRDVTFAAEILN